MSDVRACYVESFRAERLCNRGIDKLNETERYDLDLIYEIWEGSDGFYEGIDSYKDRVWTSDKQRYAMRLKGRLKRAMKPGLGRMIWVPGFGGWEWVKEFTPLYLQGGNQIV